jgi:flagellar biosynthesis protein FlhF
MRLRFVDAEDSSEAAFLAAVTLGPDAVVADATKDGDGRFASLTGDGRQNPTTTSEEVVEATLFHHLPSPVLIREILRDGPKESTPIKILAAGLKRRFKFENLPVPERTRIVLLGPPAAGKTTIIGKLATRDVSHPPQVFSTDGERPGGFEQLAEFMAVVGITPQRLGLNDITLPVRGPVLVDTSGIDPADGAGLAAIARIAAAGRLEPILVLPALMDSAEAIMFARAAIAIGAKRVLVTRLDMTRRLGALLAAAAEGLTIAGGTVTPHFAFGLKPLPAQVLAAQLLELATGREPA